MVALVFFLLLVVLGGSAVVLFLLGFRLGGDGNATELNRVRVEAAQAQRELHNLTRQAFVAMAEAVERRRTGG